MCPAAAAAQLAAQNGAFLFMLLAGGEKLCSPGWRVIIDPVFKPTL